MTSNINQVRNLGLIGHSGSGKTSLAEAILFSTNTTNRLGKVDDETSVMDFEPEEIKRKITISSSFYPFKWKENRFNIVDTPGENDFLSEAKTGLAVVEGVIVVVDAVDGVKVGTEKVWNFSKEYGLPRIILVNKMDRERADFSKAIEDINNTFGIKAAPICIPIGKETSFSGLIDLIEQKAYIYKNDGTGAFDEAEIPSDMAEEVKKWREKMIENVVEANDEIMEKYLDGKEITNEEIKKTLIGGVKSGSIVPVVPGSAGLNIGIGQLLDLVDLTMPAPSERGMAAGHKPGSEEKIELDATSDAPFSALVFKTMADPFTGKVNILKIKSGTLNSDSTIYNSTKKINERVGQLLRIQGKKHSPIASVTAGDIVAVAKLKETTTGDTFCEESSPVIYETAKPFSPVISFSVEATENEDKVYSSLTKLAEEDPTIKLDRDQSTSEIILSGMGQVHLENIKEKLMRKFSVGIELHTPRIPYRETIKTAVENVEYKHKKQSGGRGQFAVVLFDLFPLEKGEGFIFDEALSGMNVPRNFVPAVEKGIAEALESGVVAGFPVIDVKVRFFDGKHHEVDSSEMAFKTAAIMCFKKAMQEASPVLLEPIMKMEITVPEDQVGDIMGDLNSRRGKVLGTDSKGKSQIIKAEAPLAEVQKYAFDLTSLTGGRGLFSMEQVFYQEVPPHLAEKVIAAAKAEKEEEGK